MEFKFCDVEIGLLKWIDAYDTTAKGFNIAMFFLFGHRGGFVNEIPPSRIFELRPLSIKVFFFLLGIGIT